MHICMLRLRDRIAISAFVSAIASLSCLLLPQGVRFLGKAFIQNGAVDGATFILLVAVVIFLSTFSFLMYQTRRED